MKMLIACLLLTVSAPFAMAAEAPAWEFGLRGGMEATGTREHYKAGEAYLLRALPWQAELGAGMLTARIDLGAGYLDSNEDRGGWLAAGADLVWQLGDGRVAVEAGFRPAWLTDYEYGDDDFGGGVQFSSHVGIALRLSQLVLGYRFQHLSNAGIYDGNPGLDLHLFGIGVRF